MEAHEKGKLFTSEQFPGLPSKVCMPKFLHGYHSLKGPINQRSTQGNTALTFYQAISQGARGPMGSIVGFLREVTLLGERL